MVNCSSCDARYCLAEQLEWYQEIASQNPAMIQELEKEGKLAEGLVVADFETKMAESRDKQKLMQMDEGNMGLLYNTSSALTDAPILAKFYKIYDKFKNLNNGPLNF